MRRLFLLLLMTIVCFSFVPVARAWPMCVFKNALGGNCPSALPWATDMTVMHGIHPNPTGSGGGDSYVVYVRDDESTAVDTYDWQGHDWMGATPPPPVSESFQEFSYVTGSLGATGYTPHNTGRLVGAVLHLNKVKWHFCCGHVNELTTEVDDDGDDMILLPRVAGTCPAEMDTLHLETEIMHKSPTGLDVPGVNEPHYPDDLGKVDSDTHARWTMCKGSPHTFRPLATAGHCFVKPSNRDCPTGYGQLEYKIRTFSASREQEGFVEYVMRGADVDDVRSVNDWDLTNPFGGDFGATESVFHSDGPEGDRVDPDIGYCGGDCAGNGIFGQPDARRAAIVRMCCRDSPVGTSGVDPDCSGAGVVKLDDNKCVCNAEWDNHPMTRFGKSCEVGCQNGVVDINVGDGEKDENCEYAGTFPVDEASPRCNVHRCQMDIFNEDVHLRVSGDRLEFRIDYTAALADPRITFNVNDFIAFYDGLHGGMAIMIRRFDGSPFDQDEGGLLTPGDNNIDPPSWIESHKNANDETRVVIIDDSNNPTGPIKVIESLPALTRYEYRVMPFTAYTRDQIFDHSWLWTDWRTVETSCGCDFGAEGQPVSVSARQSGRNVFFSWVDQSVCEQRFNVYRGKVEADNSVSDDVFLNSFAFRPKVKCGSVLAPSTGPDLVEELELGATYRYCVEAATESPRAFSSPRSCTDMNVAWTGVIAGSVTTATGGGVFETRVVISHPALAEPIVTHSDRQGDFAVTLTLPGINTPVIDVTVAVDKTTNGHPHTYECNSVECTSRVLPVTHLSSGRANFRDTTVVTISGAVTIKDSAEWTGQLVGGSRSPGDPCPMTDENLEVCLLDGDSHEVITCTPVAPAGEQDPPPGSYALSAVIGTSVIVMPRWKGAGARSFLPVHTAMVTDDNDRPGIDFEDATTRSLQATVVASSCDLHVGPVELEAHMSSICPTYKRPLYHGTTGDTRDTFDLPAALFNIRFVGFDRSTLARAAASDALGGDEGNMIDYFNVVDEGTVRADLRMDAADVRFEYHYPVTVSLVPKGGVTLVSCGPDKTEDGALQQPTIGLVSTEQLYNVTWEFEETHLGTIGTCRNVSGTFRISDQLTAESPCGSRSDPGHCDVAITPDVRGRSGIALGIYPDKPNILSFVNFILTTFETKPGAPLTTSSWPFVVEGDAASDSSFAIPLPVQAPQLILHDPPGDASVASFSTSSSYTSEMSTFIDVGGGLSSSSALTVGNEGKVSACIGVGVSVCDEKAEWEVAGTVETSMSVSASAAFGDSLAITTTTSVAFETSGEAEAPGADSDVFIAPVITLKYVATDTLTFDTDTCVPTVTTSIKWDPVPNKANSRVFFSQLQVRDFTIPDLVRLRATVPDSNALMQGRLDRAVAAWQKTLQLNAALIANAGNAKSVDSLLPGATSTGDVPTITLGGGGAALSTEYASASSATSSFDFVGEITTSTVASFEGKITVSGISIGGSTSLGLETRVTMGKSEASTTDTETVTGYTLVDSNTGDTFLIELLEDKAYGTPAFRTTAGASMCPAEPGTVPREAFELVVRSEPLADRVSPTGTAVWEMELLNTGIETFLGIREDVTTNPDGLSLKWNSAPFNLGRFFLVGTATPFGITVTGSRGPRAYEYSGIELTAYSQCEYLGGAANVIESTVTIGANFIQPCTAVEWGAQLRLDGKWVINDERTVDRSLLRGAITNPSYDVSKWAKHPRVEYVRLEYRKVGETLWRPALDDGGNELRMADRLASTVIDKENGVGNALFEWDLLNFPDGRYDFRAYARCTPKFGGSELDFGSSTTLTGTLDRVRPVVFGRPQPADDEYFLGDEVSFAFDETINCAKPYTFSVAVEIDAQAFSSPNIPLVCTGNKIIIDLENIGPTIDTLPGAPVVVSIANVVDEAGNSIDGIVSHAFAIAKVFPEKVSSSINGIVLNIPFADVNADRTAFSTQLVTQIDAVITASTVGAAGAGRTAIASVAATRNGLTQISLFVSPGDPFASAVAKVIAGRFNVASAAAAVAAASDELMPGPIAARTARATPRALPTDLLGTVDPSTTGAISSVPDSASAIQNAARQSVTQQQQLSGDAPAPPTAVVYSCTAADGSSVNGSASSTPNPPPPPLVATPAPTPSTAPAPAPAVASSGGSGGLSTSDRNIILISVGSVAFVMLIGFAALYLRIRSIKSSKAGYEALPASSARNPAAADDYTFASASSSSAAAIPMAAAPHAPELDPSSDASSTGQSDSSDDDGDSSTPPSSDPSSSSSALSTSTSASASLTSTSNDATGAYDAFASDWGTKSLSQSFGDSVGSDGESDGADIDWDPKSQSISDSTRDAFF